MQLIPYNLESTFEIYNFRSLIGIKVKNQNAFVWENYQNAIAVTLSLNITIHFSEKNKIQLVKNVHANVSPMFQQDLRNVECIGWFEEKILMLTLGELHASISFMN